MIVIDGIVLHCCLDSGKAKVCESGLEKAELEEGSLDCSLSGTTATMAFVKKSVLYLGEVFFGSDHWRLISFVFQRSQESDSVCAVQGVVL